MCVLKSWYRILDDFILQWNKIKAKFNSHACIFHHCTHCCGCRNHAVRFQLTERKADPPEGTSVLTEANPVCKTLGLSPFVCRLILTFRSREVISLVQYSAEYGLLGTTFSHALVYWVIPPLRGTSSGKFSHTVNNLGSHSLISASFPEIH